MGKQETPEIISDKAEGPDGLGQSRPSRSSRFLEPVESRRHLVGFNQARMDEEDAALKARFEG